MGTNIALGLTALAFLLAFGGYLPLWWYAFQRWRLSPTGTSTKLGDNGVYRSPDDVAAAHLERLLLLKGRIACWRERVKATGRMRRVLVWIGIVVCLSVAGSWLKHKLTTHPTRMRVTDQIWTCVVEPVGGERWAPPVVNKNWSWGRGDVARCPNEVTTTEGRVQYLVRYYRLIEAVETTPIIRRGRRLSLNVTRGEYQDWLVGETRTFPLSRMKTENGRSWTPFVGATAPDGQPWPD